jgi:CRISPR-associated endonuclease/helicase Cas3
MSGTNFDDFFRIATRGDPFPFQRTFASDQPLPQLVRVPTGLGKTAMAVVGWLWRRFAGPETLRAATPRRLVYCLPMRVLVEQTRDSAVTWLNNLGLLAGKAEFEMRDGRTRLVAYRPAYGDPTKVAVHVLMGGENEDEWDLYPERDAILVGTQDMLLSRALNRGYAASRSRWPIQFGLLNTDCLWVLDEIQLMGAGLATTAQLEAFRRSLPRRDGGHPGNDHGCRSVWMSATMRPDWLKTVDFKDRVDGLARLELSLDDHGNDQVKQRWNASKPLAQTKATIGDAVALAGEVCRAHRPGTRTIVVVNTVRRACELFEALGAPSAQPSAGVKKSGKRASATIQLRAGSSGPEPRIVLLHSRFRSEDRAKRVAEALEEVQSGPPGTIVVSTQVIEAGVDVSAATLFTELAPWASLVQRFGRCNRRGEENENAKVWWIDVPTENAEAGKTAPPYELSDLETSRSHLRQLQDVGAGSLAKHIGGLSEDKRNNLLAFEHTHVIRRKDLIDLFDTTPDLAGNDIDIDRYVREVEETDVRVFWRDYGDPSKGATPNTIGGKNQGPDEEQRVESAPRREELCPAPVGSEKHPGFRQFAKEKEHIGKIWRWNFLNGEWERADASKITPGQVYLVHSNAGGYSADRGWDSDKSTGRVEPVPPAEAERDVPDATDDERFSRIAVWQTITEHTDDVCAEIKSILDTLKCSEAAALREAARWHDWGKAHRVFQGVIDDGGTIDRRGKQIRRRERPEKYRGCRVVAKAPGKTWDSGQFVDAGFWRRYDWPSEGRKHFRHELASALAVLRPDVPIGEVDRDLVAYLIAAHHGKVRLSIRSLPEESRPPADNGTVRRFARGVWDGDALPAIDLGGGVTAPGVEVSLEPMELGLCQAEPFAGQGSWAERMIRLRDTLGPFRLAYLEAILRAADMRASERAGQTAGKEAVHA